MGEGKPKKIMEGAWEREGVGQIDFRIVAARLKNVSSVYSSQ